MLVNLNIVIGRVKIIADDHCGATSSNLLTFRWTSFCVFFFFSGHMEPLVLSTIKYELVEEKKNKS